MNANQYAKAASVIDAAFIIDKNLNGAFSLYVKRSESDYSLGIKKSCVCSRG